VNARVIATGAPRPMPTAPPSTPSDAEPARRGARTAWLGVDERSARVPVYDGERLAPGMTLAGPALVERRDTTVVLSPKTMARVEAFGDLVIEVADG